MHTWNIARREPISKFSSGRENDPHRNALGWRASARHVRSRTPRGVSENLFGPLFSTGLFEMGPPIKLIFFNHLGLLCNKNGLVPSFRSSISFPFFSLSLSLILRAHSFLCFVSVFFFFILYFVLPCFWQGAPLPSSLVIPLCSRVLFYTVTNHVRPLTRVAEYCSGLKEEEERKKWDG